MNTVTIADPGIGRDTAPVGTTEWAQRVRLHMQALVNDVDTRPESLNRYVDILNKHRAWTMLNKPDGSFFATFEDFCEHKQPWGLGRSWEKLRPLLEAVAGKQVVQLATVSPAATGNRFTSVEETPAVLSTTKEKAIRAILRAPIEVQDLYREELISQDVAAKLGPKDPSKAPSREAVVEVLAKVPRERKAIDGAVREMLGTKKDAVRDVVRAFLRLDAKQRRRFYDEVEKAAQS